MLDIGSTVFVRNAIEFDYCILESIESILSFSKEIVVIDCSSTDGTDNLLVNYCSRYPKIKLFLNQKWEVGHKEERLPIIANIAREKLSTEWHFMIQADEVLHESSIPFIEEAIQSGIAESFNCRRYNMWGDVDYYTRFDSERKLVGDDPVRLAKKNIKVVGDAYALEDTGTSTKYLEQIKIIHYGFVRKGTALLNKAINVQAWYFDDPNGVDKRLLKQKEEEMFDPNAFLNMNNLARIGFEHPKAAKNWVEARRNDLTKKAMTS